MPLTIWIAFLGPHLTFDFLFWLIPFLCFPIHLVQDFPVPKKKLCWIWSLVGGSPQKSPGSLSLSALHHILSWLYFTDGEDSVLGAENLELATKLFLPISSQLSTHFCSSQLYTRVCMQNFSQDHWRQLPKFTPFIYLKFFLKSKVKFLILFDLIATFQ